MESIQFQIAQPRTQTLYCKRCKRNTVHDVWNDTVYERRGEYMIQGVRARCRNFLSVRPNPYGGGNHAHRMTGIKIGVNKFTTKEYNSGKSGLFVSRIDW